MAPGHSLAWRLAPTIASIAALTAPASAQSITAEQAIANYRRTFAPIAELDCPKPADGEEIVVCGRAGRPDPYRAPLPVLRTPGLPHPGEAQDGSALACLRLCDQPLSIDLIKAAKIGRKIIRHIFDPD
jgi:hypothetical protein